MIYQRRENLKTYGFKVFILSCIFCFGIWANEKGGEKTSKISSVEFSVRDSVWMLSSFVGNGTGFFIAPDKLITNFHVISGSSENTPKLEEITLSQEGYNRVLKIKGILALSALYDLALLETEGSIDHYLSIRQELLQEQENLFITGYLKDRLTDIRKIRSNTVFLEGGIHFFVNTSELRGVSGSPVVDTDKQVVGVASKSNFSSLSSSQADDLQNFISIGLKNKSENHLKQLVENEITNLINLANQGDMKAQAQLGSFYLNGVGVAQSNGKALYWFGLAAEQGHALAQYDLGVMYRDGNGIAQNYREAFRLVQSAAEQGYVPAITNLGEIYFSGRGVFQHLGRAFEYYQLAAEQGDALARFNLGNMYGVGKGVTQSNEKSLYWLGLAAEQMDIEISTIDIYSR